MRFSFTVYGPWGRPDMSPFLFADAMLHGRSIKVFNMPIVDALKVEKHFRRDLYDLVNNL